jgi:hypothetical protein
MTSDITRDTHRPPKAYSSVRLQQGRVQIDADWNEAEDIALRRDRVTARDVIGPSGVPEGAPGFALIPADPDAQGTATDLLLGYGRAYVDGVLVENLAPAPTVLAPVQGAPDTFLVQSGPLPGVGQWLVGTGAPPARVTARPDPVAADGGRRRVVLAPPRPAAAISLTIAPSLLSQPDASGNPTPPGDALFGLLLEVSERDVTALDDPYLRETALGGPDTATRRQIVWRVVADASGATCKSYPPDVTLDGAPRARLSARGVPASSADDPCLTPDPGGYRGIDNRLYRVEVHRGGPVAGGNVRILWSRDNATHRTRFTVAAGRLRVDSLGRDDATALDQGQWVELHSEAAWRAGGPGHLLRLGEVNGNEIAIAEIRDPVTDAVLTEVDGDPLVAALPVAGLLRRWESGNSVAVTAGVPIPLEAGIEVTIGAGTLREGDAWIIPARALTADVEWPRDPASGAPLAIPPPVVLRRYMSIGIVQRNPAGRLSQLFDCRRIFPPLTSLVSFQMLGGDGQEAMPDLRAGQEGTLVPLAAPLRVGVTRGTTPLPGRLVRFTTADAPDPGRLDPVPGTPPARVISATPTAIVIATDAAGVAEVRFSIQGRRTAYAVEARLLDAADPAVAVPELLPLRFFAASEVASEVAFNPANCLFQRGTPGEAQPAATVQQALDRLCPAILMVPLGGDGQTATPGEDLPAPLRLGLIWAGRPLAGIAVSFEVVDGDATVQPAAATTGADGTVSVTLRAGTNTGLDGGVIRVRAKAGNVPQPSWPTELDFTARFGAGAGATPSRLRPIEILSLAGPRPLEPSSILTPAETSEGFLVRLDGEIAPEVGKFWFTGEVWIDLPAVDVAETRLGGVAYRTDGQFILQDPIRQRGDALQWVFSNQAREWLRGNLPAIMKKNERNMLTARLVLHGGAVFGGKEGRGPWLDGGLHFAGQDGKPVLPGGHGVPGSVLTMPFRIGQAPTPPTTGGGGILVAVTRAALLATLNAEALATVASGLDVAVDRTRLRAVAGVPGTVNFAVTPQNAAEARQRTAPLLTALATRPPRVFLRESDRPLFEAVAQQIRQTTGIAFQAQIVTAPQPEAFATALARAGGLDLAFGDAAFLAQVETIRAVRFGDPLLVL